VARNLPFSPKLRIAVLWPALAALLVLTNVPREASALFPRRSWAFAAGTALLLTLGILALGAPTPFLYLQF